MYLKELCFIIALVVASIVVLACIISICMKKIRIKSEKSVENIYLDKLENSDNSIKRAMQYLKLTNGIENGGGKRVNV